jgi:hypothetical protein
MSEKTGWIVLGSLIGVGALIVVGPWIILIPVLASALDTIMSVAELVIDGENSCRTELEDKV